MLDRKLFILLLVVFIDLLGFGIVIPILPLLVERVGGNVFLVGVIIALFSLFQFLFSPILGRLSDKYGRKPVLIVSSFINAISYSLIFFSQALLIIFIARIVAGIGSASLSVAQAYIADSSTKHERTKRMGFLGASFSLGFIIGPLLGGVVSEKFGIGAPFLIPAILSLINTFLIFIILPESNKLLQKDIKIELFNYKVTREVLRPKNMSFLLILFFFINFVLALIIGVFPIFSQMRFGWTESQNGYYFGLIGLGSFITQAYLISLLLKKINEIQMIRLGLVIFGIAVISIGLTPFGWLALIAGPFTSMGFSLLNVNIQSLISLESDPDEQGIVLGVAQSFAALARVFGPLTGGAFASLNIALPYIISGFLSIFILLFGKNYLKLFKRG
ncbi:MAG: MFS transporter [Candidatus Levybacteria bacterium]|nr:MFS transporter [Candidatus Levybacteria bacterium]